MTANEAEAIADAKAALYEAFARNNGTLWALDLDLTRILSDLWVEATEEAFSRWSLEQIRREGIL
jgi:hypothetical protein